MFQPMGVTKRSWIVRLGTRQDTTCFKERRPFSSSSSLSIVVKQNNQAQSPYPVISLLYAFKSTFFSLSLPSLTRVYNGPFFLSWSLRGKEECSRIDLSPETSLVSSAVPWGCRQSLHADWLAIGWGCHREIIDSQLGTETTTWESAGGQ